MNTPDLLGRNEFQCWKSPDNLGLSRAATCLGCQDTEDDHVGKDSALEVESYVTCFLKSALHCKYSSLSTARTSWFQTKTVARVVKSLIAEHKFAFDSPL